MYKASDRVFIVVYRAKTHSCVFTAFTYAAVADPTKLFFGSLDLHLDTSRQRMEHIKVGIVDIRCEMDATMVHALSGWIVLDRLALITGWFGKGNCSMVEQLAIKSRASGGKPLYQEVMMHGHDRSRGQSVAVPSFFILFGEYRRMRWAPPSTVPSQFQVGQDIEKEMVRCRVMPSWHRHDTTQRLRLADDPSLIVPPHFSDDLSPFVPNLGSVVMKAIAFEKVAGHSFQTTVWLGTSTPSRSSQLKCQLRRSQGKGKGKGSKGKHTGKGKGKVSGKF